MDDLDLLQRLLAREEDALHGAMRGHGHAVEDVVAFMKQRLCDAHQGGVQPAGAQLLGQGGGHNEISFLFNTAGERHGI